MGEHQLPVRRACQIVNLSRAAYYRPPVSAHRRDAAVIAALTDVVARYPRWGFWKCYDRLRLEGAAWNHKRVHRVYCALRLNLPRRTTRRIPRRVRRPLVAPPVLNQTWALDFMADALYDRRRFRALTIIDEGNREGLAIDVGRSIPARRVTRVLDELIALHGRPTTLRMDNGPELTAQARPKSAAARTLSKAQVRLAQAAMTHRDTSVSALCRELGIAPVTLYRYVGPQGQSPASYPATDQLQAFGEQEDRTGAE